MLLQAVNFTGYFLIRRTLLVVMETLATHKTMYFKEVDKSVVSQYVIGGKKVSKYHLYYRVL